mmetsp:Transcript_155452/g.290100  ORF Transcript_155452/g.290100 Transcript_155452/m.290100 type:complete len:176 (+) Transcript_155452:59-586(+)
MPYLPVLLSPVDASPCLHVAGGGDSHGMFPTSFSAASRQATSQNVFRLNQIASSFSKEEGKTELAMPGQDFHNNDSHLGLGLANAASPPGLSCVAGLPGKADNCLGASEKDSMERTLSGNCLGQAAPVDGFNIGPLLKFLRDAEEVQKPIFNRARYAAFLDADTGIAAPEQPIRW